MLAQFFPAAPHYIFCSVIFCSMFHFNYLPNSAPSPVHHRKNGVLFSLPSLVRSLPIRVSLAPPLGFLISFIWIIRSPASALLVHMIPVLILPFLRYLVGAFFAF